MSHTLPTADATTEISYAIRAGRDAKSQQCAPTLADALRKMVDWYENLDEGAPLDPGCNLCTDGMTPKPYRTGPCAYHVAKAALKQWDSTP